MLDEIAERHWEGEDLKPLIIYNPPKLTLGRIISSEAEICILLEQIKRYDDNIDDLFD